MLEHNRRDTTIGWHREPEAQGRRGCIRSARWVLCLYVRILPECDNPNTLFLTQKE